MANGSRLEATRPQQLLIQPCRRPPPPQKMTTLKMKRTLKIALAHPPWAESTLGCPIYLPLRPLQSRERLVRQVSLLKHPLRRPLLHQAARRAC
ncbi:hypothetical protein EMPG_10023 [Blastomyces silverae]|uniref:Uncharacterized protein n=1 Tax=Blastomyces silverae TaxID=2060906 RepID=A0A0H1B7F2_9EURO|nr:hypothetical protein EMPG_10023 [Blastomyces silverae]